MKRKILNLIIVFAIFISAVRMENLNVKAGYNGEQKYTISQCISFVKQAPMLSNIRLFQDNHGYYAVYNCNGRVECYLGKKNSEMYFSDFAKKLGGETNCNVKKFTVTKTERELKKMGVGVLCAYICGKLGCPWYTGYLVSFVGDKLAESVLRSPGEYKMTTVVSSVRVFDCAFDSYMTTYYFDTYGKLEKYNKKAKKWEKVWSISKPVFNA